MNCAMGTWGEETLKQVMNGWMKGGGYAGSN
jgi:hypothetical protein